MMPLWKDSSLFDSSSMNISHDEPKPSCDAEKKDDEGISKASGVDNQERPESSTLNINTDGTSINTASTNLRNDNVTLEATNVDLFGDETEMDMSNLNASYQVPTTPNTRIHKDHSLDHVIGDIQSGVSGESTLWFASSSKSLYSFGSTKKELCLEFKKLMHDKFQMSSMGELTFFLGLQVKHKEDGNFIIQDKYVTNILKKFGFQDVRTASTPTHTEKPLLKDSDGDDVDVHLY
ncbi:putative ribonuclease H-like domain-containing protein, partial [Tanacetum coccineum]